MYIREEKKIRGSKGGGGRLRFEIGFFFINGVCVFFLSLKGLNKITEGNKQNRERL